MPSPFKQANKCKIGITWAFRTCFSMTWHCQPCRKVNEIPLFSQLPKPWVVNAARRQAQEFRYYYVVHEWLGIDVFIVSTSLVNPWF